MNKDQKQAIAINAIQKKLLGKRLSYREIYMLMDEIGHHRLSDVLTTYFVASSFREGFSAEELYFLTKAMVNTGTRLNFKGMIADKHSSGGVAGTRTTLIIVPIIAAAGIRIPKTSSRAITSPAGTADVMETMAKVTFNPHQIETMIDKIGGCVVWGGHLGIAPADDVIIRIEEPLSFEPFDKLIVSIMAKKVAVSATHLVLDIPVGKTMKIRHFFDAEKVTSKFKQLGNKFGMKIVFDVNETLEPAGRGVGPALEARDVLYVLEQKKERPLALEAKALRLAGKLLQLCFADVGVKKNGEEEARRILTDGRALKKFHEIIHIQGGDADIDSDNFKMKSHYSEYPSARSGKIKEINNYHLNMVARILGAPADKYAGLYLYKKVDEFVSKKEPLLRFYSSDKYRLREAEVTIENMPVYEIE